jgi:hypothetical protein
MYGLNSSEEPKLISALTSVSGVTLFELLAGRPLFHRVDEGFVIQTARSKGVMFGKAKQTLQPVVDFDEHWQS